MGEIRVLVIDDEDEQHEILGVILGGAGYEMLSAKDGTEGFTMALSNAPEAIILDVMMASDTEGFHTAYKLRNHEETRNIPIIMITGVSQASGFKFGGEGDEDYIPVDTFLEKPVDPNVLLAKLKEVIQPN